MAKMRVYVAASSQEIERARRCIAWLKEAGIEVAHDWPALIDAYGGDANQGKARIDRMILSRQCVDHVSSSTHFWFLFPSKPTIGAWVELGCFTGLMRSKARIADRAVASGRLDDFDSTIFTGLFSPNELFELDRDAFAYLAKQS